MSWEKESVRLRVKVILQFLLLFLLFLIFLLVNINAQIFTDESDNFVGGMLVASGYDVYSTHISQHMPGMYYLCAIFRLLGASSIYTYRLAYDVFLALLWTVMYFRYSPHFGKITMLSFPIFYVFQMAATSLGTTIISDQLQAQGMVILLMEFLLNIKRRKIPSSSCIWISIAICFSFGTTFVSIYAVLVIALGVFAIYAFRIDYNPIEKQEARENFFRYFGRLIIAVLIPFALLTFWYAVSGNLKNFYIGAYKLNREVYSKYTGGYGTSAIKVAVERVNDYFSVLGHAINTFTENPQASLQILLRVAANIAFLLVLIKDHWMYAGIMALFILSNGMRGFTEFHALPYLGTTMWMFAYLTNDAVDKLKKQQGCWRALCCAAAACVMAIPYLTNFSSILSAPGLIASTVVQGSLPSAIQKLVPEDEPIYVTTLQTDIYISANRRPVLSAPSSVPWMYEVYKDQEMAMLQEKRPRVIYFSLDWSVWGYALRDYAPDFIRYITENYSAIGGDNLDGLYIRNDYLSEARELLGIHPLSIAMGEVATYIGPIYDEMVVSQVFTAKDMDITAVSIYTATFQQVNATILTLQVLDVQTGDLLQQAVFDRQSIQDNLYALVEVPCSVQPEKQYELKFSVQNTLSDRFITFYRTADGTASDQQYAMINGNKESYNLCLRVLTK